MEFITIPVDKTIPFGLAKVVNNMTGITHYNASLYLSRHESTGIIEITLAYPNTVGTYVGTHHFNNMSDFINDYRKILGIDKNKKFSILSVNLYDDISTDYLLDKQFSLCLER